MDTLFVVDRLFNRFVDFVDVFYLFQSVLDNQGIFWCVDNVFEVLDECFEMFVDLRHDIKEFLKVSL